MVKENNIHVDLVDHLCGNTKIFKARIFEDSGNLRFVILAPLWEEHPHAPIATITIKNTTLTLGMPHAQNVSFDIADPKLSPQMVQDKLHEAWEITKDSWEKS